MHHKMAKAAEWPLYGTFGAAVGILLALHLGALRPHDLAQARLYDGTRDGSVGAAVILGWVLFLLWCRKALRQLGKWLAAAARTRAAKKEIRMATLLGHADPLKREVTQCTERLDEVEARQRGEAMKFDGLMAAFSGYLAEHGYAAAPDLEKTGQMPVLRLAAKDGQIIGEEKRDSA